MKFDYFALSEDLKNDLSNDVGNLVANVSITTPLSLSNRFLFIPGMNAHWLNRIYAQANYGVTSLQAE